MQKITKQTQRLLDMKKDTCDTIKKGHWKHKSTPSHYLQYYQERYNKKWSVQPTSKGWVITCLK